MKTLAYVLSAALLGGGAFFLLRQPATLDISALGADATTTVDGAGDAAGAGGAEVPPAMEAEENSSINSTGDIGPQPQMQDPPVVVKGVYLTGWSAGSTRKMSAIYDLLEQTGANAVVIDIKDYSGYVSYEMDFEEPGRIGAEGELRIAKPNQLIKDLHDRGIYVIGRVTVFQDPIFAEAHPELALKSRSKGGLWRDRSGLAWIDPASREAWDYVVEIAKDGFARGFDEINFDYVRFPSDGALADASYPFWDQATPRREVMRRFFAYLRQELPGELISADLFGLTTTALDDLGIGQVIEDAYPYFDYISPMVYPSHYASGFIGYKNPGAYPYEVMNYALEGAVARRDAMAAATSTPPGTVLGKVRPWVQDFNLGATYTPAMVQRELQAVEDALHKPGGTAYAGYLVWDPRNNYSSYGQIR